MLQRQQRPNGTVVLYWHCPRCGGRVSVDVWREDLRPLEQALRVPWAEHVLGCRGPLP